MTPLSTAVFVLSLKLQQTVSFVFFYCSVCLAYCFRIMFVLVDLIRLSKEGMFSVLTLFLISNIYGTHHLLVLLILLF